MKKYFLIAVVIIAIALSLVSVTFINFFRSLKSDIIKTLDNSQDQVVSSPTKYQYISKDGINIIIGDLAPSLFESPEDNLYSTEEIVKNNNLELAVNGGYFAEDKSYIGLLWDGKSLISDISQNNPQATHIAHYSVLDKKFYFIPVNDFKESDYSFDSNNYFFQAGPLILNQNEIETSYIDNSLNGNLSALRTFIGYTDLGEFFVGVTTQGYDLRELGNKLTSEGFFKDKTITVFNLDGGSSTSLYSKENQDISFRYYKTLPFLIGFK